MAKKSGWQIMAEKTELALKIYREEARPEQEQIIRVLKKHNPKLVGAQRALQETAALSMEIAEQLKALATEQEVVVGHAEESMGQFEDKLANAVQIVKGFEVYYNDPETVAAAMRTITDGNLLDVFQRLDAKERMKVLTALDQAIVMSGDREESPSDE